MAPACASEVRVRAIHTGKSMRSLRGGDAVRCEARSRERGNPLRDAVIAHMRRIAQEFECLQVRIEERVGGRDNVDENSVSTRLEDTPGLAQSGFHVLPVVRAEAAENDVELGVAEGQMLGGGLYNANIRESPLGGGLGHNFEHAGGNVAGYNLGDVGSGAIADVAAAASEIERAGRSAAGERRLQLIEVVSGAVIHAGDVVVCPGRIMAGNEFLLGCAHAGFPLLTLVVAL